MVHAPDHRKRGGDRRVVGRHDERRAVAVGGMDKRRHHFARGRLIELIMARKNAGRAALIATHSMALAAMADRIYRIVDGRILGGEP